MNTTSHTADWNLLKGIATAGRSPHWAGIMQQIRKGARAAAAFFAPHHPVSSLRVVRAGVLRSDHDRLILEPSEEVRFQVASQMFLCDAGKPLVFDDTWNQDAWHHMNGYRVEFTTDSVRTSKKTLRNRVQNLIARLTGR